MTNNFTPAKAGQQSKRLSKEEYAEKMKAEKEAVYQMADDTAKAIVSDPEKFKAFLDTQSRLDRYSAVNALLIFKQLPEASQLKNFDDWYRPTWIASTTKFAPRRASLRCSAPRYFLTVALPWLMELFIAVMRR